MSQVRIIGFFNFGSGQNTQNPFFLLSLELDFHRSSVLHHLCLFSFHRGRCFFYVQNTKSGRHILPCHCHFMVSCEKSTMTSPWLLFNNRVRLGFFQVETTKKKSELFHIKIRVTTLEVLCNQTILFNFLTITVPCRGASVTYEGCQYNIFKCKGD